MRLGRHLQAAVSRWLRSQDAAWTQSILVWGGIGELFLPRTGLIALAGLIVLMVPGTVLWLLRGAAARSSEEPGA